MKINVEITGDLERIVKRTSKNGEMSYSDCGTMLCRLGAMQFTKTLSKELKKDKRNNKWYVKLFRRNK